MWYPVVFFHDLRGKSLDFSTENIQQHDFAPAGGEKHIGGPDAFGQRRGGDIYPVKHAKKRWKNYGPLELIHLHGGFSIAIAWFTGRFP